MAVPPRRRVGDAVSAGGAVPGCSVPGSRSQPKQPGTLNWEPANLSHTEAHALRSQSPASEHTETDAVQMRGQLNGLKSLIDAIQSVIAAQVDAVNTLPPGSAANVNLSVIGDTLRFTFEIPQGQEGLPGPQGPPFAQAIVDAVNTLNPGDPATVSVGFDGTNVRFTFGIPRGNDGSQGPPGNNGNDGGPGPQGPPFAQAIVDGVNTLNPGEAATVSVNFDGSNVRFTFGIPRGNDGSNGTNGTDGPQGPPGEVTTAQLNAAIVGTSNNTNGVATLDTPFADPDAESMRQKLNEFLLAARR